MRYLITNDLQYIKRNKVKLLLYCLVALFIGIFFKLSTGYLKSNYTFYSALGLKFESTDIIALLIFLIQQIVLVILAIDIIEKDISNNMANIFLRMNMTKWIISKIAIIIILSLILKAIIYIFAINIDLLMNNSYYINNWRYVIIWYAKDNLITLFNCLCSLILYIITLSHKNKMLFIIVIGMTLFLYNTRFDFFKMKFTFIMLTIIMLDILIIMLLRVKRKEILEVKLI